MKRISFYFLMIFLVLSEFVSASSPDSLINVLITTKDDTLKVTILNNLFLEFEYTDDGRAFGYLNESLELCKKKNYQKGLFTTYTHFAYYYEDKSDYHQALINYTLALKIAEKLSDSKGIGASYNSIGVVYYYLGNYLEALKNSFASLKIREKIGDKKGMSSTYNSIGGIYFAQGNFELALKNYQIGLGLRLVLDDKKRIADSYNNIGNVYVSTGKYAEALISYNASLKIKEVINDTKGLAASYSNIGSVYFIQKNYSEALKNYLFALEIKENSHDARGTALSYHNIGTVYLRQKQYNLSDEYLSKAEKISKEIGYKEYLKNTYFAFSELDSARGNYKGAYENHKKFILYRDSLDNEETRKKTIQSQMTYDFEKKEAVADAEHKKELEKQELLANEKSRKQIIIILFVVCGLLLVILFAAFVFRSLKITRKQKGIIEEQKSLVELQKLEVEQQKAIVEEHQKEIIDSITYARRIQQSLLPTEKYIHKTFNRLKR